jgi:hypothetical protein
MSSIAPSVSALILYTDEVPNYAQWGSQNFQVDYISCELSNGKYLYIQGEGTGATELLKAYQIDSSGHLASTHTIWSYTAGYNGFSYSLTYVSDTVIYIMVGMFDGTATSTFRIQMYKYNSITGVSSNTAFINLKTDANNWAYGKCLITDMKLHTDGKYYALTYFSARYLTIFSHEAYLLCYTPDTTLIDYHLLFDAGTVTQVNKLTPIGYYYDSSGYFYACYGDDIYGSIFQKINLASHAFETLCVAPTPADFPQTSDGCITQMGFKWIGIGYEVDGSNIWLYFTHVKGYLVGGTTIGYKWVQHRLVFNTTISAATLLDCDRLVTSGSLGTFAVEPWVVGYKVDYDEFYFWMDNREYSASPPVTVSMPDRIKIELTGDWFDYSTPPTIDITITDMILDLLPTSDSEAITIYGGSMFNAYMVMGFATDIRIYYGMSVVDDFTYSLVITPNETPKFTQKTYVFSFTFLNNGVPASNCIVLFYVDGSNSTTVTKVASSAGVVTLPIQFNSEGTHTIMFEVYKNMFDTEMKLTDTLSYLFYSQEIPDEEVTPFLIGNLTGILITFLPACLCIMVPAIAGAKAAGLSGFLAGTVVGDLIAVGVGVMPTYTIYLMILIASITFIMVMRSGNRSASQ